MMTLNKKKQRNAGTIAAMTVALQQAEANLAKVTQASPQDPVAIANATAAVEYRKSDLAKQQAYKVVR